MYTYAPYDILQVFSDTHNRFVDFCSIRSEDEANFAVRVVNTNGAVYGDRATGLYRIVSDRGAVKYTHLNTCETCHAPATCIVEDHSRKIMTGTAKLCARCATRAAETIQRDGGIPAIGNL